MNNKKYNSIFFIDNKYSKLSKEISKNYNNKFIDTKKLRHKRDIYLDERIKSPNIKDVLKILNNSYEN